MNKFSPDAHQPSQKDRKPSFIKKIGLGVMLSAATLAGNAQKIEKLKPIIVTDQSDPRLWKYEDSLASNKKPVQEVIFQEQSIPEKFFINNAEFKKEYQIYQDNLASYLQKNKYIELYRKTKKDIKGDPLRNEPPRIVPNDVYIKEMGEENFKRVFTSETVSPLNMLQFTSQKGAYTYIGNYKRPEFKPVCSEKPAGPLIVHDKNDPRLKKYNDSLNLYKLSNTDSVQNQIHRKTEELGLNKIRTEPNGTDFYKGEKGKARIHTHRKDDDEFAESIGEKTYEDFTVEGISPTNIHHVEFFGKPYKEHFYYPEYQKPTQEVIYKKPFNPIGKLIFGPNGHPIGFYNSANHTFTSIPRAYKNEYAMGEVDFEFINDTEKLKTFLHYDLRMGGIKIINSDKE